MRISVSSAAMVLAATFGVARQAEGSERVQDGLYVVEAHYAFNQATAPESKRGGCMIVSNNGQDTVPSLYHWGRDHNGWGQCGMSNNRQVVLQNRQAVWQIYSVAASDGQLAHVIKSHVDGRCLIRGHNGHAAHPSLHLWTDLPGGNTRYCGFRTADELVRNGQAAWSINVSGGVGPAGKIVHSFLTERPATGYVSFSPLPAVYPNTANRHTWGTFTRHATPWWFFFVRMDP